MKTSELTDPTTAGHTTNIERSDEMKPEDLPKTDREALDALADADLTGGNPADAFLLGFKAGRTVSDDMVEAAAEVGQQLEAHRYFSYGNVKPFAKAKPQVRKRWRETARRMLEAALKGGAE